MTPTPHDCNKAFEEAEDEFGDHKSTQFLASIAAERLGIEAHELLEMMASLADETGHIPPATPGRY